MYTTCPELSIPGVKFPAGSLEYKVYITGESGSSSLSADLTNSIIPLNQFMSVQQPEIGTAISIDILSDGSLTGHIANVVFSILGTHFVTPVDISDILAFNVTTTIFEEFMTTFHGEIQSGDYFMLTINGEFAKDSPFYTHLQYYVHNYITTEVNFLKERLDAIESSMNAHQKLFNNYNEILAEKEATLQSATQLYNNAVNELASMNNTVNQYQAEVDVLMNNNNDIVNSVFAICKQINCKPSCLSWPICDVSENYMSIEEWGIKEVIEIEKLLRNEIGYLTEPEWDVRYLCRLVTNIKSWGVTKYGQVCSYKSTFENVTHNTLIANHSYVNVYHHRPWMVDLLSFPVIETCCSENVCTLLQDAECTLLNSACHIAQQNVINSMSEGEMAYIKPLQNLNEAKANLTILSSIVSLYEYKKSVAEYDYKVHQEMLKNLYKQLPTNEDYDSVVSQNDEIFEVMSYLEDHYAEDIFTLQSVRFEVTVSDISPSSFPVTVSYAILTLNNSYEVTLSPDFLSTWPVLERDIASAVITDIGLNIKQASHKAKRQAISTPVYQQRFEQYCAILMDVKQYLSELNQTLVNSIDQATETITNLVNITNNMGVMIDVADVDLSLFIDFNILHETFGISITADELLLLALKSPEYVILNQTINDIHFLANTMITEVIDNNRFVSWWNGMNIIHNSTQLDTIGNRKCFGFVDCLNIVVKILEELLRDSPDDLEMLLLPELSIDKENFLKVGLASDYMNSSAIERIQIIYDTVIQIESHDYWCSEPPVIVQHPTAKVYANYGSNITLQCEALSTIVVSYKWAKEGFVILNENANTLRMNTVTQVNEGRYQCYAINAAGTSISTFSDVSVVTAPKITQSPLDIASYEGSEDLALFVCNATGHPSPGFRWYFSTDKINWNMTDNSSSELVVYKPTKAQEGWYRCSAFINNLEDYSEAAFLTITGASISQLSFPMQFYIAVFGDLPTLTNSYMNGLQETVMDTLELNANLQFAFIEGLNVAYSDVDEVFIASFHLSTRYQYSLSVPLADQASEALKYKLDLEQALTQYEMKLQQGSISFEYRGNHFVTFPHSYSVKDMEYVCIPGQELQYSNFICG